MKPVAGNAEVGWIYNQGKCQHCECALMGDIPPDTNLEKFEYQTRDICCWCQTGAK